MLVGVQIEVAIAAILTGCVVHKWCFVAQSRARWRFYHDDLSAEISEDAPGQSGTPIGHLNHAYTFERSTHANGTVTIPVIAVAPDSSVASISNTTCASLTAATLTCGMMVRSA